jgi:hypothetical protein
MLEQHQQPPLLVGERAVWLGSGSGLPQGGHVRWIGKLPGMGPGWTVGLELVSKFLSWQCDFSRLI